MSDFANIPAKLIHPTKKGDKVLLTVVYDENGTAPARFIKCVLSPEKANLVVEAILVALDKCKGGENR